MQGGLKRSIWGGGDGVRERGGEKSHLYLSKLELLSLSLSFCEERETVKPTRPDIYTPAERLSEETHLASCRLWERLVPRRSKMNSDLADVATQVSGRERGEEGGKRGRRRILMDSWSFVVRDPPPPLLGTKFQAFVVPHNICPLSNHSRGVGGRKGKVSLFFHSHLLD